jgi:hypothetical protein
MSWWIASARSRLAFRSAVASSLPTSRARCKIVDAKYPPMLGDQLVHLQLIVELEDPPLDVHRSCSSRRRLRRRVRTPRRRALSRGRLPHPPRRVKRDGAPAPSRFDPSPPCRAQSAWAPVERQPLIML